MKKILSMMTCLLACTVLHAQVTTIISSGTSVVNAGASLNHPYGNFVNNGTYLDTTSPGLFIAGGVSFQGSGTTTFFNLQLNSGTLHNDMSSSVVSVLNTATIGSGDSVDAGSGHLWLRTDLPGHYTGPNLVNNGLLSGTVNGLMTYATTISGPCPSFTSTLSSNVSGSSMMYQWQSSPDSIAWSNVSGATNATYAATVSASLWYRCQLTTINTGFNENTQAIKLILSGSGPVVGVIIGPTSVCVGDVINLSDTTAGGTWSGSNGNAVVTTGAAAGVYPGLDTVSYTVTNACGSTTATMVLTINPMPSSISGSLAICTGSSDTLTDAGGGTWSSGLPGVATIDPTTGIVTPVNAGTTIISYTLGTGCAASAMLTVNSAPSAISGALSVCFGTSDTLTDAGGGTWTSGTPGTATIGALTGVISTVNAGTTTITYTLAGGCYTSVVLTVNALPSAISGALAICYGASDTLTDGGGGTWTSGTPGTATIGNTSGIITTLNAGTTLITYALSTGCTATAVLTVNALPSTITGPTSVCAGSNVTLTDAGGGTWTSGSTGVATIGSSTGIAHGVNAGNASITYTLSTGCTATTVLTVNALPDISNFTAPSATTICKGNASTVTVNSTSLGSGSFSVTYNLSGANVATGLNATLTMGATNGTFTIPAGNLTNAGPTTVTIGMISNTHCGISLTGTNTAAFTVNATPAVYNLTGGGAYCSGGTGAPVGLSGSQTGIGYQLYFNGTASGSPMSGTGAALSFGLKTVAGVYTVVGTNTTTTCFNNMNGADTVSIISLPSAFAVTGGGAYCSATSGVHVGLSGSQTGVNYQLYRGATADGSAIAGTGSALDFGLKTVAATYTVTATVAAGGCNSAMTGNAIITINPSPALQSVTGGGTFCSGGVGFHVGVSGSQTGYNYQLNLNGSALGTALAGNGSPLDYGYQTTSGTYTVVASANGTGNCPTTMTGSAIISATSGPTAFAVTGTGSYCYGGTGTHVGLAGSQTGVNYQLHRGASLIGGLVAGTNAALDFGLQTAGTYTVTATTATGGCSNNMTGSAVITITNPPTAYALSGGGAYCSGSSGPHVNLAASQVGVNYQLYLGSSPVGGPIAGTGGALDFGVQTTAGTYTVIATVAGTSCSSTMTGSVAVTVALLPTAYTVTGGGVYCTGGTGLHVGLSGSANTGGNVTYFLYLNGSSLGSLPGSNAPLDFGLFTGTGTYTVIAHSNLAPFCTSNQLGSVSISTVAPPVVAAIAGPTLVHNAATITLTDATPLGTWSTSNAYYVTVSMVGVVTGVSLGGAYISYTVSNGTCAVSQRLFINEVGPVPPPQSSVTSGNTVICAGAATTLTNTVSGGSWTTADKEIASVGVESGVVKGLTEGIAVVTYNLTTTEGTAMVFTPVVVNGAPDVLTINAKPGMIVTAGQEVTFTAAVGNSINGGSYQWFINGKAVSGAHSSVFATHSLMNGDVVSCVLNGDCGNPVTGTAEMIVNSTAGINAVAAQGSIRILPNPNKGTFSIVGSLDGAGADEAVSLEITDVLGQVVYRGQVIAHGGALNETVQLDKKVANGMYLLSISAAGENKVFHVVVEK